MSAAASTLLSQYNYSVLVAIAPSITGELLPSRNVKWKQVDRRRRVGLHQNLENVVHVLFSFA